MISKYYTRKCCECGKLFVAGNNQALRCPVCRNDKTIKSRLRKERWKRCCDKLRDIQSETKKKSDKTLGLSLVKYIKLMNKYLDQRGITIGYGKFTSMVETGQIVYDPKLDEFVEMKN